MELGKKMIFSFLLVGVLPFVIVGTASLQQASSALKMKSFSELKTVQTFKKKELETYFEKNRSAVRSICTDETVIQALIQFKDIFTRGGINQINKAIAEIDRKVQDSAATA